MSYETAHWRTFNRFVRVFGLLALFVGGCLVWGSIAIWWDGRLKTLRADAPSRTDDLALFIAGIVAIVIGVSLLRARPYRPDLGDSAFGRPTAYMTSEQRLWWTGDRRSEPSNRAP